MSDIYTCSLWTIPDGRQDGFVAAFEQFAAAADELGAREVFNLEDEDDPARFIVVRRWESAEAVERCSRTSGDGTRPEQTSGNSHRRRSRHT